MNRRLWIATAICLFISSMGLGEESGKSLQLTLPPHIYAVPGVEMSIYFDNIVLTQTPEKFQFDVTCDLGSSDARRWTLRPNGEDVGTHPLEIAVRDKAGNKLSRGKTELRVLPANAGENRTIKLLIIGDSLTHATLYPNEISRLLSMPRNPKWTMLGTHKPKSAAEGVAHEGYGGWTWARFATKYEPNPDGTYRKRSSPFVYLNDDGKPALDVKRYFEQECAGERPDFVVIMLGINDCFSAKPDDQAAIDDRVNTMFAQAELVLADLQKAAPKAEIGICLTTPPNSRQAAFEANYGDNYSRWGWKRIQHRLVQRQLEKFKQQHNSNLFLVPTELNLDPIDGYPANNGVHPNANGYKQIGASIYSWLKWRLASDS